MLLLSPSGSSSAIEGPPRNQPVHTHAGQEPGCRAFQVACEDPARDQGR